MPTRNPVTEELQVALQGMANSLGMSLVEYVQSLGYATTAGVQSEVDSLQSQITAIVEIDGANGAESLAEKIAAINEVLSSESGELQAIYTKIQENKQLVLDETARATAAEAALQVQVTAIATSNGDNATAITALQNLVATNKTAQDAVNADVEARLAATESSVATLTGDDTVVGSVAKAVKDEKTRAQLVENANAQATADEATRAQAAEQVISDAVAAIQTATGATDGQVSGLSTLVAGILGGSGLNPDGSMSVENTSTDATNLYEYIHDLAGDGADRASDLRKAIRKLAKQSRVADKALDARLDVLEGDAATPGSILNIVASAVSTEQARAEAAEAALAVSIAANTQAIADMQSGSGATLSGLDTRIGGVEDELNDTTVGGELSKGLKSRVEDLEAGQAVQDTAIAQGLVDAKAYSDSKDLAAVNLDICAIGNSFRSALGLALVDCSGTPDGGDGDGAVL